jgi:hypothetical protein
MPYAFRNQPLKGLYLTYQFLSTLFIRFPFWVLLGLSSALRPRKTWDFKRSLMVNVIRHLMIVVHQSVKSRMILTGSLTNPLKDWTMDNYP